MKGVSGKSVACSANVLSHPFFTASLVFNENGRYFEGGDWRKLMYGAFAGPVYVCLHANC